MIEFPCIYCGKLIRAEESPILKHMECPACGHTIPVRQQKPSSGLDSSTDAPNEGRNWTGMSDKDIAKQLLSRPLEPLSKAEQNRQTAKRLLSPIIPQYDDLTLFALSLAFLLIAIVNAELRQDLTKAFSKGLGFGTGFKALLVFAGFGMVRSLVNIFIQRKKSDFEKWAMLLFAVLVTAGTGIYAGRLMLNRSQGWLMVFAAWNILNGGLLLVLTRVRIIDADCIIDKKATFGQVLVTAVAVPVLLITCLYLFDLHWAITFSIAIAYTMNLHNALRHFLKL